MGFLYNFNYQSTYTLTLVQPGFNFEKYPNDEQTFNVRYSLINYDAYQLQLYPIGIYCSQLLDGSCSATSNPIWDFDGSKNGSTSCTIYYDQRAPFSYWPAFTQYSFVVSRKSDGLIVRLVLPISFLLLLSAATFWLSYDNRIQPLPCYYPCRPCIS